MKLRERNRSPKSKSTQSEMLPSKEGKGSKSKTIKNKTRIALKEKKYIKTYRVPKSRFEAAIQMLKTKLPKENSTTEQSCCRPIHSNRISLKKEGLKSLLELARICFIQHDWLSLAKVLSMVRTNTEHEIQFYMPSFIKYGLMCLHYTNQKKLLDSFLRGVIECNTYEKKQNFINECITLPINKILKEK